MITSPRIAVLLLALAASAPSFAQSDDHPKAAPETHDRQMMMAQRIAERFKSADTNHDGKLTLEEAQAGMPMVAKNFDQIDAAKTGSVTLEQVMAAAKSMRGGRERR